MPTVPRHSLPLLPLILDDVPQGLRQALGQEGIPFRDRRPGPPEGRFVLFDSRNRMARPLPAPGPLAPGQVAVDVEPLRDGWHGHLARVRPGTGAGALGPGAEADPLEALADERPGRCAWQIEGFTLTDQIARVDKRAVRRHVLGKLHSRIEGLGGIWLRLGAFPFPYRSALSFRIDYDQYDPDHFAATLAAIRGHEDATSHFVSGSAYEPHREALARLRGLDVGSHGYWHHTYRTAEENLRNVARGIEVLRAAGIEPSGFTAPHGRFHRGLLAALETLGVSHSSEFGLAYDELPFEAGAGNVLQIPVHPVCLGLFLEAARRNESERPERIETTTAAAVDAAIAHFVNLVQARYRSGEPAFLYGHPTGRLGHFPQVLQRVFDEASQWATLWKTTLSEFSRWWRLRSRVRLTVTRREDRYVVAADRTPQDYRLTIEYLREDHIASMRLDEPVVQFAPEALAYERRPAETCVRPVRIDQPEGLRGRLRRWIDWERVTPVEQIPKSGWRNRVKRSIRRWSEPRRTP